MIRRGSFAIDDAVDLVLCYRLYVLVLNYSFYLLVEGFSDALEITFHLLVAAYFGYKLGNL